MEALREEKRAKQTLFKNISMWENPAENWIAIEFLMYGFS